MTRRQLGRTLAILVLAAPALASDRVARIEARAPGSNGPRIELDATGTRTLVEAGRRITLATPKRLRIESLCPAGADLWLAGTVDAGDGSELWIARGADAALRSYAAPAPALGAVRENPVLLAAERSLRGLAWLEGAGHDRLEVRYAEWAGEGFAEPELVAPPGNGSQLALQGVRLADGRLLLVWAGFDGEDDEIWAALRSRDGWSQPVRVGGDNHVPDIVPAVIATESGAWIAWTRFDRTEYRVALAALEGERFGAARFVAPLGSLYPTFERGPDAVRLLYRDAREGAWALAELSSAAEPGRQSRVEAPATERPVVSVAGDEVVFRFASGELRSTWH